MGVERPDRLFIPVDNRPAPLDAAPVPIWEDEVCQMSFGERVALEGVLSQSKPRLAIEIGTYEGGSLRFLARHCEHVHTFDLFDLVEDRAQYRNVTFHTGDSKLLLPELLRALEADGSEVDLALVDGDHSAEGVRRDLEMLLDSPATRSTMILLHDTMNEQTRAGIESVGLAAHAKVVYHELDMVAGYEFAGGHFDGQMWGGLGVVLTGEHPFDGYRESSAQTRYREPYRLAHDGRRFASQLAAARLEAERAREVLAAVQSSPSWRLTAPLRYAKRRLRSARSAGRPQHSVGR